VKAVNAGKEFKKMKNFLIALGLGVAMWVAPAGAQSSSSMRFDIPFAFVAGDKVMPAGAYRVTVDPNFNMARFDGVDAQGTRLVRLVPGSTSRPFDQAHNGSARFTKVGEQYVLTGIWKTGAVDGNDTITSRKLVESAKTGQPVEVVTVGAGLQ
jgi:hypothetical protein